MRVHIVSSPLNISSGFSIVARNLGIELMRLVDENGNRIYDVSCTGLQQAHNPETYFGIKSYPTLGTDLDEMSQLIMNIKDIDPDIIWNLFQSDSGDFGSHAMAFDTVNRLNESAGIKKKIMSYWYTPVESLGLSGIAKRDLLNFIGAGGRVVSQCKWGKNEMMKEGIENVSIYHGVDGGIFKPMDEKEKIYSSKASKDACNGAISNDCRILRWIRNAGENVESKKGKWDEYILEGADKLFDIHKGRFVFLVVAANVGVRKRLERAMKAYAIFLRKGGHSSNQQLKDRTLLHIHTQPFNPEGIKVMKIAEKLGIEKNIIFSYGRWKKGWTDVEMSVLYNSSSCYLSASSGEGFGIGTLESMSCGIPTIGPRNTSFIELIEEKSEEIGPRGILVDGEYQYIIDGSERFLINEEELAEAMEYMYGWKVYGSDVTYEMFKNDCLKFARNYTWDRVANEWNKLFKET